MKPHQGSEPTDPGKQNPGDKPSNPSQKPGDKPGNPGQKPGDKPSNPGQKPGDQPDNPIQNLDVIPAESTNPKGINGKQAKNAELPQTGNNSGSFGLLAGSLMAMLGVSVIDKRYAK